MKEPQLHGVALPMKCQVWPETWIVFEIPDSRLRLDTQAALGDLHVHGLRHTVGMRLREAGVAKETRSIVLWHKEHSMTTHYSAAQVLEVRAALERIKHETGRENRSLRSLAKEARQARVPSEPLQQGKTG